MFKFKKFNVLQEKTAMKVGTDGVLLGAWTSISGDERQVLDIGSGTGLLSLMLAQRLPNAQIDAVEIDADAYFESLQNVENSPFASRILVYNVDIQQFSSEKKYDLIISNPPFFTNSLKCPNQKRAQARHNETLNEEILLAQVLKFLGKNGTFSLVFPFENSASLIEKAENLGLFLVRKTTVFPTPNHAPKRLLMQFALEKREIISDELIIEEKRHVYTEKYKNLTKEFYLNF